MPVGFETSYRLSRSPPSYIATLSLCSYYSHHEAANLVSLECEVLQHSSRHESRRCGDQLLTTQSFSRCFQHIAFCHLDQSPDVHCHPTMHLLSVAAIYICSKRLFASHPSPCVPIACALLRPVAFFTGPRNDQKCQEGPQVRTLPCASLPSTSQERFLVGHIQHREPGLSGGR